ncbi:MAG: endonuclease III, partial [Christensenellaceae bacterium]
LGFAHSDNPDKVEEELTKIFKREDWADAHHWLIWHGRKICKAQKPLCEQCCVKEVCPYYKKQ